MEKKMMGCLALAFGLMILVLNASASPSNDITCQAAITDLMPCQPFLVGSGPATPSFTCCEGAQNILNQATTTATRRALCECFKNAAKAFGINPDRSKKLPQLCKINVPVPLDPNVDCQS